MKAKTKGAKRECPVTVWTACYKDSWRGLIVDEAFAH
jgi:hypothetical protein